RRSKVPSEWLEIIRLSVKAEGSLTARPTSRAGTKVGLSDPVVPHGRAIAQRIKATPGITGLSPPRVHIDGEVWHLRSEERRVGKECGASSCHGHQRRK